MIHLRLMHIAAAIVMLGLFADQVRAATVTATMAPVGISGFPVVRTNVNGVNRSFYAGEFTWIKTGGTFDDLGDEFRSFCIELDEPVDLDTSYTWEVVDTQYAPNTSIANMGLVKAEQLSMLFGGFYHTLNSDFMRAAFQLAIWEIIYDDNLNLSTGDFYLRNVTGNQYTDFVTLVNPWLAAVGEGNLPQKPLLALSSPSGNLTTHVQDQIFVASVPLPPALAMGLGLMGILGIRRWLSTHHAE